MSREPARKEPAKKELPKPETKKRVQLDSEEEEEEVKSPVRNLKSLKQPKSRLVEPEEEDKEDEDATKEEAKKDDKKTKPKTIPSKTWIKLIKAPVIFKKNIKKITPDEISIEVSPGGCIKLKYRQTELVDRNLLLSDWINSDLAGTETDAVFLDDLIKKVEDVDEDEKITDDIKSIAIDILTRLKGDTEGVIFEKKVKTPVKSKSSNGKTKREEGKTTPSKKKKTESTEKKKTESTEKKKTGSDEKSLFISNKDEHTEGLMEISTSLTNAIHGFVKMLNALNAKDNK